MTTTRSSSTARQILMIAPPVVVFVLFFAAIPWMKDQNETLVMLITAAAALFVMGYSAFAAIRHQSKLDEVQRAGARFASQAGAMAGSVATVALFLIPPVQNLVVDAASLMGTGSTQMADRESVLLAFAFGFCALAALQGLGALIAGQIWRSRMDWR